LRSICRGIEEKSRRPVAQQKVPILSPKHQRIVKILQSKTVPEGAVIADPRANTTTDVSEEVSA
jgi:hypothetical protein